MNLPSFESVDLPWRRRPAEYVPGRGWYQEGERLRRVKPHYHFVWPKDGKGGTTFGRWKDILQNKGPDLHVTISADKNDHMHNRQRRARWSHWTHLDDRGPDGALSWQPPWVQSVRRPGQRYDFRLRKYRRPDPHTWSDAYWQEEPNENLAYPSAVRAQDGEWWEDRQGMPDTWDWL